MMEQMIEAAGLQCASSRHDAMRDVAFDVRNSDVPTFSRNMDSSDAQRRDSRVIIGVCDEHGVRMAKKGHSTMCLTLRGKIVFSMMGALLCLCMIGLLMPQVARSRRIPPQCTAIPCSRGTPCGHMPRPSLLMGAMCATPSMI